MISEAQDGLPGEKRGEIRDGWQNTLPDLVADLPEFGHVYGTLEEYADSLVDQSQR